MARVSRCYGSRSEAHRAPTYRRCAICWSISPRVERCDDSSNHPATRFSMPAFHLERGAGTPRRQQWLFCSTCTAEKEQISRSGLAQAWKDERRPTRGRRGLASEWSCVRPANLQRPLLEPLVEYSLVESCSHSPPVVGRLCQRMRTSRIVDDTENSG